MNELIMSNSNLLSTSTMISSAPSSVYFIAGGAGYSTNHQPDEEEQNLKGSKFDPGLIYPSACLFCGIPNGQQKSKETITTPYDPCITNAPTMPNYKEHHWIRLLAEPPPQQHILIRINSTLKTMKRFFIRKYVYIIMYNKKRLPFHN